MKIEEEDLKADFSSQILSFAKEGETSKASEFVQDLSKLVPLFPKDFDIQANPDVFPFVVPMAIANRFNRNGVGVDYAGAMQIREKLRYKYVDYEHNNGDIIGTILDTAFSTLDGETTEGDPEQEFMINTAAILYRFERSKKERQISEIIRSANPEAPTFGAFSASWEVNYRSYNIALGSHKISECEIITDPYQKLEFKSKLKVFGGSGYTDDDVPVFQLLQGSLTPIGIGLVRKPAAHVKGLYGVESDDSFAHEASSAKKIFDMAANNSQLNGKHVNLNRTNMDEILEQLKKIQAALAKPDESGESIASLTSVFAESVKEANKQWLEKVDAEKNKALEAANKKEAADTALAELTTKFEELQTKFNSLQEAADVSAANELFSARMEQIDTIFKLDEDLRKIVVADLKSLSGEEDAFNAYFEKTKVLLKGREKNEDEEKKVTLASALIDSSKDGKVSIEDIKTALASLELEVAEIPNSATPTEGDITARFAKAFAKDQIKIQF